MKKKYLAHTCSSNDLKKDFLLYKNFWLKVSKRFDKFYFINLINLIDKKKSSDDKNYIKKKFPKNLIIFTPKTYSELKLFLKKNQIITFISLGRDLKYFYTLYLLKKFKSKILVNLTIGYTGQNNNFFREKNNYLNNLYYFLKFIVLKKIIWLFFRFFVFINIFPKIEILFDGSKKNINIYKNYFTHKIKKKIPWFNISYIKEVIHVNFRSYETLIDQLPKLENKYIVFLDSCFDHGDAIQFQGRRDETTRAKYYFYLEKTLKRISGLYKKKIIICLHPKTDTNILKKYIKDISIKKHQSSQFITKAAFVLFHDSSIILDAIFLRKKIINLRSPLMGKYYEASNKKYSKSIKMPIIDMSQYQKINKKNLDKFFDNKNLYKNYLKNFLTFDLDKISKVKNKEKLKGSEQIITILNERFFKN